MKSPSRQQADIIVIGAGMSGLVAAQKLQERFLSSATSGTTTPTVMVLEGRDRLGGRIHTIRPKNAGTIELGAAWIHGHSKKNPMSQLVKQVNQNQTTNQQQESSKEKIKTFHTNWDDLKVYTTEGSTTKVIPSRQIFQTLKQHDKLIKRVQHAMEAESTDISLQAAIQKVQPQSLKDPLMNLIFSMSEESDYGGSLDDLSTWWFNSDGEFPGPDALLSTGFQTLIDHVAEGLDVRTNVQVQSIQYTTSTKRSKKEENNNPNDTRASVQIETTDQGTFTAKYCIVTVPLGVLKANTIQFLPALPLPKQKAIQTVGFGTIAKVVLIFDTAFWPLQTQVFASISSQTTSHQERGKFHNLLNMYPVTGKPVLVAFSTGDYVKKEMEKLDDATVVQQVMEMVQIMFGSDSPEPIETYVTRWGTDPFSRGTYSYHAAGQEPYAWHDLAESVDGVLYFAGEHCWKKYRGSLQGAYLSGERAAHEVYKQITKQTSNS